LNTLKHGAFSDRKLDPVAMAFVEGVLERRPDLGNYPERLYAWGRAEARALLLGEYISKVGIDSQQARMSMRFEAQFQRLAANLAERLGLDPKSEAELAQAQASAAREMVDLEALRAKGQAVIEANSPKARR
jgi:hypothetical protein